MSNHTFPALAFPEPGQEQWTTTGKEAETAVTCRLDSDDYYADQAMPAVPVGSAVPAAQIESTDQLNNGSPVSSVMEENLWTVHAEDTIEKVEALLAEHGLTSIPVMGSNGVIVGMIGEHELALFHADNKNSKSVRAWEISRFKTFEVNPDDSVEEVAKLMSENKIDNIAVTASGGLQGVVSVQDLLTVILK